MAARGDISRAEVMQTALYAATIAGALGLGSLDYSRELTRSVSTTIGNNSLPTYGQIFPSGYYYRLPKLMPTYVRSGAYQPAALGVQGAISTTTRAGVTSVMPLTADGLVPAKKRDGTSVNLHLQV